MRYSQKTVEHCAKTFVNNIVSVANNGLHKNYKDHMDVVSDFCADLPWSESGRSRAIRFIKHTPRLYKIFLNSVNKIIKRGGPDYGALIDKRKGFDISSTSKWFTKA
jgi:hypothetical protein